MSQIIPTNSATASTVPAISTDSGWSMDAMTPKLPDARDFFEVRMRGTKTLVLIPKNTMAQALLWDWMNKPRTSYVVSGAGFQGGSTSWIKEATIEFGKPDEKLPDIPAKKVRTARRRRPR